MSIAIDNLRKSMRFDVTDGRDEATRLLDHAIWSDVMGAQTPREVMGWSAFEVPEEVAYGICCCLQDESPRNPALAEYGRDTIYESLLRTLKFEGLTRGELHEYPPN